MNLPKDPMMLLSVINMKLRDEYRNLEELCEELNIDQENLKKTLSAAGFDYDEGKNAFR